MYSDPFLLSHAVEQIGALPRQFELSKNISPVSIRDQIVRGIEITKRLVASGCVPSQDGRLLIIGGGVAGFAAAFQAIGQGVSVTVLEKQTAANLFAELVGCTTRRLDPTFYDWPLPHWRANTFISAPTPFAFSAGPLNHIVAHWQHVIQQEIAQSNSRLDVRFGITYDPSQLVFVGDLLEYIPTQEMYHAVLYAAGMGDERVWPPQRTSLPTGWNPAVYYGPHFWKNDNLHQPRCGEPKRPDVLIAGAGDGALQDYVRILTGHHPAEILEALDDALAHNRSYEWLQAQYELLAAQELAAHQYTLGYARNASTFHKNRDLVILENLHSKFEQVVQTFFNAEQPTILSVLDPYIAQRRTQLPRRLHLLVRGLAFSWCYTANRFLVLLLDTYLLSLIQSGKSLLEPTLLYDHQLVDTDGTNVNIRDGAGRLRSVTALDKYDIVVIRRGIEPSNTPLYRSNRGPRERHIMPCHSV